MDFQADVTSRVLSFVFERMRIDGLWSVREPRGFRWWPYRVSQRIWAEPLRTDDGFRICKVHAETDVLKEVPPTAKTYACLAAVNSHATLNRYVYNRQEMRIRLACCAYFHAENIGWQEVYFHICSGNPGGPGAC
jgi:hypothetical protein